MDTTTATTTNPPPVPKQDAALEITLRLLDWPFLLFVALLTFMLLFRKQLYGLLSRGDILVSWGDGKSIRLRDLSDKLDQELDPLRDDVDQLKVKQAKATLAPNAAAAPAPSTVAPEFGAVDRMKQALADPRFRWRTIDKLAVIGGVTEDEAVENLRSDPSVVFALGKSGKRIARLASR